MRPACLAEIYWRSAKGQADAQADPADLNDTRNTQPALFIVESLIVDELRRQEREPAFVAGHSLGELVALYAAGVFDVTTGLALMQRRSELMAAAGGGAMTAVIGFDRDQLESLVKDTDGVVIANDNSAAQVVISGNPEAVKSVSDQLTCKRAIPLAVSGAFHSPLMAEAAAAFNLHLEGLTFKDARFPVLSNTDPTPCSDASQLKATLVSADDHGRSLERNHGDADISGGRHFDRSGAWECAQWLGQKGHELVSQPPSSRAPLI